jgi:hypothetical protein
MAGPQRGRTAGDLRGQRLDGHGQAAVVAIGLAYWQ